jgi:nicotinate-nucleotide--dimethylbenzimidazole phosphoribosyltransferase
MAEKRVPATLDEMRAIVAQFPGPDRAAAEATAAREAQLTKPPGALGRLEEITHWMASWQGKHPPSCVHSRTAVFAGNHGVAKLGVSAYPAAVTVQMVKNFVDGGAAVNQLCRAVDADLRVYEMALDEPTEDFTKAPAMSEEECATAIAYGMMAVEPGIDLLAVGEMGIANTTSAAALAAALYGGGAARWVGPGTGVDSAGIARKVAVVDQGVALHKPAAKDGFDLLRRLGGRELAAMVGAIMAARMAHVPVLLDGYASSAAAATLAAIDSAALDHCLVAHCSAEPGHRLLLEHLHKKPLIDFGMRLGEGSGATLAVALVKAALACHVGMATFAEAGVSGKDAP